MKEMLFFIALLMLSATTIAMVSIASNVSLPVLSRAQGVTFYADFSGVEPNGDPVGGGGGGPGCPN